MGTRRCAARVPGGTRLRIGYVHPEAGMSPYEFDVKYCMQRYPSRRLAICVLARDEEMGTQTDIDIPFHCVCGHKSPDACPHDHTCSGVSLKGKCGGCGQYKHSLYPAESSIPYYDPRALQRSLSKACPRVRYRHYIQWCCLCVPGPWISTTNQCGHKVSLYASYKSTI